jgi:hypothetical protein
MSVDKILEHMLDAIEANNHWDTEAYAQMALDRIEEVNEGERDALRSHLESVIAGAQEELRKEREKERLIEEIVNFRG